MVPETFDARLLMAVHEHLPVTSNWVMVMKYVTQMGSTTPLMAVAFASVLAFVTQRQWRKGSLVFMAFVLSSILDLGLKQLFHRARPGLWYMTSASTYSFPSGHAMRSVVVYGALTYLIGQSFPKARWAVWSAALVMLLTIGFSRLYLGVHWPTDVLGGWLIGLAALWALLFWYRRDSSLPFPSDEHEV